MAAGKSVIGDQWKSQRRARCSVLWLFPLFSFSVFQLLLEWWNWLREWVEFWGWLKNQAGEGVVGCWVGVCAGWVKGVDGGKREC